MKEKSVNRDDDMDMRDEELETWRLGRGSEMRWSWSRWAERLLRCRVAERRGE